MRSAAILVLSLALTPGLLASPPAAEAEDERPAPESADTADEDLRLVERVTVTATRSETEIQDTASSTSVVSDEEIERYGMRDARDLLRYEPGVTVAGDPTRYGSNGFEIRGIGGNRVMTLIDGVRTSEQFDFGPIAAPQLSLDLDTVESVEISRSAGSALYGSDALGGVVSFHTKDPGDWLLETDGDLYLGFRAGYDTRFSQGSGRATAAFRTGTVGQGMLQVTERAGEERRNEGRTGGEGLTRTEPNPQDRDSIDVLGKWNTILGQHGLLELEGEWFDAKAKTEALSFRGPSIPGLTVTDFDADDRQERFRFSAQHTIARDSGAFEQVMWRAWAQQSDTLQRTVEQLSRASGLARRDGSFELEERSVGGELQLRSRPGGGRHRLTYGFSVTFNNFDQRRDRNEVSLETGAPIFSPLVFPTKYAPESDVLEAGFYIQDEIELAAGRVGLIPGLRYDHHDLDADQGDAIYLAGNPGTDPPVDITDAALSPKLGVVGHLTEELTGFGQYARGFRAPPYSEINSGFANPTFGYVTLPSPGLEPETSDNFEVGLRGAYARGSFSVTVFDNHFDDFIATVDTGLSPGGLIMFQPQNLERVRISGVELWGDLAFGERWIVRAAGAWNEGEDRTTGEPLEQLSPPQWVTGLRYRAPRWQAELTGTYVAEKDEDDLPSGSTLFAAPSYVLLDLFGTLRFSRALELQAGLYNLTDEKYWVWADVRGQNAGSAGLDRYTSPGFSVSADVRYSF